MSEANVSVDRLAALLESWEAVVRGLRVEAVILRAERDEARRALAMVIGKVDQVAVAVETPARPTLPPADQPIWKTCVVCGLEYAQRSNRQKACANCREVTGHRPLTKPSPTAAKLTDADLARVAHLPTRMAARTLGVAHSTVHRYRTLGGGFAPKRCKGCRQEFKPAAPNNQYCDDCQSRRRPAPLPPPVVTPAPTAVEEVAPPRVRVIDGVEFVTVWDGSMR